MTLPAGPGEGPSFSYAGQPVHILAGHASQPAGFAAMELTIPASFAGPIPHAHDEFDEALFVLAGRLQVFGDEEPREASAGSMSVAPRGQRHGFRNPFAEGARVLRLSRPGPLGGGPPAAGLRVGYEPGA